MILHGSIMLNNAGKFNEFVKDNAIVLQKYFGVFLFPGSINVMIKDFPNLHSFLDTKLLPDFIIPKEELINMPSYLGNGQAWRCQLINEKWGKIDAWVFRRINSKVRKNSLEIVSDKELNKPYNLSNNDEVLITIDK